MTIASSCLSNATPLSIQHVLFVRYKLFLSEVLDGTFLNIADKSGYGQDHCQFVGGTQKSTGIKVGNLTWGTPSGNGKYVTQ